jgi:hypothetical protein
MGFESQNVIATLPGSNPSDDTMIIICAHYDTTETSPGANDDGSGIATLLALANIFSSCSFDHTIRFIAFSGEEVGTIGSHHYAKQAYEQDENIIAVLNLETFGYTSSGGRELFLLKTARTEWISQFSHAIAETYHPFHQLDLITIGNRPCDHQAFLEFGYDAVQYVQLNRDDYPLHSPEDSLDKINYHYLTNVTRLMLAIAGELAFKPIDVQIKIITPYEGYLYVKDAPLIQLPGYNKVSRLGLRGMTYLIGSTTVSVEITTDDAIESVFFCIDGISEFYGERKEPPYEWHIQSSVWRSLPLIGHHTVGVYVWTDERTVAYDEMDFFALFPIL